MNKYNPKFIYPQELDKLDEYINPASPKALDDIGVSMLRAYFFANGLGGGYDAVEVLAQKYGRKIDYTIVEYPQSKRLPRWVWLAGAAALVGWYVLRNNKPKGIFGKLEGKTFNAGDLS